MESTPIRHPVVAVLHEGRAYLWDGYHRTGFSIKAGRTTIPAILGTKIQGREPALTQGRRKFLAGLPSGEGAENCAK